LLGVQSKLCVCVNRCDASMCTAIDFAQTYITCWGNSVEEAVKLELERVSVEAVAYSAPGDESLIKLHHNMPSLWHKREAAHPPGAD
jgi:hypothetical protein